jgi:hypothetical protein
MAAARALGSDLEQVAEKRFFAVFRARKLEWNACAMRAGFI